MDKHGRRFITMSTERHIHLRVVLGTIVEIILATGAVLGGLRLLGLAVELIARNIGVVGVILGVAVIFVIGFWDVFFFFF